MWNKFLKYASRAALIYCVALVLTLITGLCAGVLLMIYDVSKSLL